MTTFFAIAAVVVAAVMAIINGLDNNNKFDAHKSNFKIEGDSLIF
jgi:hypothetical protein